MKYTIVPGLPEMKAEIDRLRAGLESGMLDQTDKRLAKKLFKAIANLARDPRYAGLQSHEIEPLTNRYSTGGKIKVFESYLENNTPGAGRLFWVYGPESRDSKLITLIGLEPHPEDRKSKGHARVQLSRMPAPEELAQARKEGVTESADRGSRGDAGNRRGRR